jgi:hypothetical protein
MHFITPSADRGRSDRTVHAIAIPATAQAIIAARIDRLSPEHKRLLRAASVIGKDVPLALLQAIARLDEGALGSGLRELQATEFLYETRLFPDAEYTFKHALTQEVTYGSLLQDRRRTLHASIVDAWHKPPNAPFSCRRLSCGNFAGVPPLRTDRNGAPVVMPAPPVALREPRTARRSGLP